MCGSQSDVDSSPAVRMVFKFSVGQILHEESYSRESGGSLVDAKDFTAKGWRSGLCHFLIKTKHANQMCVERFP